MKKIGRTQKELRILVVILLVCVLIACTNSPTIDPHLPTEALFSFSETPKAKTAYPTPLSTLTPTPLSLDAHVLKDIVFSDCIPVEKSLPKGIEIPWNVLVEGYIIDLENGKIFEPSFFNEEIPEDGLKFLSKVNVSPDGEWVSYPNYARMKLYIESATTLLENRNEVDRIEIERNSVFYSRWIDDEILLLKQVPPDEDDFYLTIYFNPFTGEENVFLLEDMPNYLDYKFGGIGYITHYKYNGELVPDPTMKKVIYLEMLKDDLYNTLWDRETESPLARLRYLPWYINDPLWAQDGSNVLLLSYIENQSGEDSVEWFSITADGVINQVTQFEDALRDYSYYINHSSRSRDGKYLVFQLIYNYRQPNEVLKYIFLDLQSNQLEGFCFPVEQRGASFELPIWSPDNRYVLISNVNSDRKGNVFVIDVENKTAYKIAEDMDVLGWIVRP